MAALAHGMPIVTTAPVQTIPELDGALITMPSNEPNKLAKEILTLWQTPERREQLGRAALAAAELFRWDRIAERTVSFFQSILAHQI